MMIVIKLSSFFVVVADIMTMNNDQRNTLTVKRSRVLGIPKYILTHVRNIYWLTLLC